MLVASILSLAPVTLFAQTTSLPVTNFDFETNGLADGGFSNNATATVPTGWDAIPGNAPGGAYYGYFNPTDDGYTGTSGDPGTIGTMSGPNVFYFGTSATGEGIQQTLSSTFALNTTYELTLSLGCRNDASVQASIDVELLAGSLVLASGTFHNSVAGTFADYSLTYTGSTANDTFVGTPLTVRFAEDDLPGDGTEVDMDNVRLTATGEVPEPSTLWWLASGGLALAAVRRWRANA